MDDLQDALGALTLNPGPTVLSPGPPYREITNVDQLEPGKFYTIHDTNTNYDFIATYNGFGQNSQQLSFTILYKRSQKQDPRQDFTNPWVGINVRYDGHPIDVWYTSWDNKPITKKDINRGLGVEVNPNFVINVADLSTTKHVYQSRDLDAGANLQIYDNENRSVTLMPIPIPETDQAMDTTSGGKRRKSRRRTKRSKRKGRRSRKTKSKVKVFYGGATINYPNGNKYDGDVDENQIPNGEGRMRYKNGDVYEGNWVNGQRSGFGRWIHEQWGSYNDVYEGNWENDMKNGQGTMTYSDRQKYVGNWENDNKSGQGTITYPYGNMYGYEGNWANNFMNGQGTMTYHNGKREEGNWVNGQMTEGTTIYPDGSRYEGTFISVMGNHQRSGFGTMINANGDIYEGKWENDAMNGFGTMTLSNGDVWAGRWANGKKIGRGTKGGSSKKKC